MKNGLIEPPGHLVIEYTNGTGADIASGAPVAFGGRFGVAATAIPNGKTGALKLSGRFSFTKGTGYALAQGQAWTWDGTKAVAWTPASATPRGGAVAVAAGTNDTSVEVNVDADPPRQFAKAHVVSGAEGTAKAATIDTGFGADPSVILVQIRSTTGVHRSPQGIVSFDTERHPTLGTIAGAGFYEALRDEDCGAIYAEADKGLREADLGN